MSGPCSGLEDFLALFDNDPSLKAEIEKVISHHFDPSRPMRDQWVELDPLWGDAEPMLRFAKVITPDGPGYTQCICVYRRVSSPTEMSYREMLFDEVKSRYGEKPLSFILEADRLAEIFQPVQ
jgi:hypothetical protein